MAYTWEQESIKKYGEEVTSRLIKQQKDYEEENKDNDCKNCGKGNEGAIIEWQKGRPIVMHYGLWVDDCCKYCGEHQHQ